MTHPNPFPKRIPNDKSVNTRSKVAIQNLPTGVKGMDVILGGGLPEYSFNIIAGTPGCGKTTLAHQIIFKNATAERPAIYFTVLGEPAIKMLRYQQQYSFFDERKLGKAIRFVNLADIVMEKDLNAVLDEIIRHVTESQPAFVVVDSFRTVVRKAMADDGEHAMQSFVQRLAQFLTGWEATSFLVGEYVQEEVRDNPVFTVADGLFWLSQVVDRNSVVRKLQIMKLRGQESVPGLHTLRIGPDGIQAFSRTMGMVGKVKTRAKKRSRISSGITELDQMLGGGFRHGDSILLAGPSGTGKTVFSTHFIAEGLKQGEPGIIAIFEGRPKGYSPPPEGLNSKLKGSKNQAEVEILYLRPLDLSVDETMQEILDAVHRLNAKRLVIDSLAGLEMALAPQFRTDFRESLYRMIGSLTAAGITVLCTAETEDNFTGMPLSNQMVSFLTDDVIRMRYVEIDGQLRKVIVVVKMRGSNHSKEIREYDIRSHNAIDIYPLQKEYARLTTGLPVVKEEPTD